MRIPVFTRLRYVLESGLSLEPLVELESDQDSACVVLCCTKTDGDEVPQRDAHKKCSLECRENILKCVVRCDAV